MPKIVHPKLNRPKVVRPSAAANRPKIERPKTPRQIQREADAKANDPLGEVEYTGNAETDSLAEMSELNKGFRERRKNEQKRFTDATDSEYWCALCFQTREQKEEFLQKLNLAPLGDKYIDGMKAAGVLGIEIEAEVPPLPKPKNHRGQFKNLIREVNDYA